MRSTTFFCTRNDLTRRSIGKSRKLTTSARAILRRLYVYREFQGQQLITSFSVQKDLDRAFQGLSNDMYFNEIKLKTNPQFNYFKVN